MTDNEALPCEVSHHRHPDDFTTWDHPELPKLAAKVAKLRTQVGGYVKKEKADIPTKSGGKFSYDYADINGILAAIDPLLEEVGLCLVQPVIGDVQHTILIDVESGAMLDSFLELASARLQPQDVGSKQTYLRRYTLVGLLGLKAFDDDSLSAHQASRGPTPAEKEKAEGRAHIVDAKGEPYFEAMIAKLIGDGLLDDERKPPSEPPPGWAEAVRLVRNDPRIIVMKPEPEVAGDLAADASQAQGVPEGPLGDAAQATLRDMMTNYKGSPELRKRFASPGGGNFPKLKDMQTHQYFEAVKWIKAQPEYQASKGGQ